MQAASVSTQPDSQISQAEPGRIPMPVSPGKEAPGGASFRTILARNLRDLAGEGTDTASKKSFIKKSEFSIPSDRKPKQTVGSSTLVHKKPGSSNFLDSKSFRTGFTRFDRSTVQRTEEVDSLDASVTEDSARGLAADQTNIVQRLKGPEKDAVQAFEPGGKNRERRPGSVRRTADSAEIVGAAAPPSQKAAVRPLENQPHGEDRAAERSGSNRRRTERKNLKVSVLDLRMRPEGAEPAAGRESRGPSEGTHQLRETAQTGTRQAETPSPSDRPQGAKAAQGAGFSDILAKHISDAGAQDIVKAAHIVLRDGDSGMIRLRLEPESLGNVKIELKMTEKNITGRIVVETEEARNAFEKSLSGLREAFAEGGFETASLEVSVGGGQAEEGGEPRNSDGEPFFTERLRDFDRSLPTVPASSYGRDGMVDIWA